MGNTVAEITRRCKSDFLATFTDFQLFAMNKSNKAVEIAEVFSPNSTEN